MSNWKKKVLSGILAVTMLSTSIPAFSASAEEFSEAVTTENLTEQTAEPITQETEAEETTEETSGNEISLEISEENEEADKTEAETDGEEKAIEIISQKIDGNRIRINAVSSEANGNSGDTIGYGGEKENAIDGDINTMWHTAWNKNDREKYITFEFNDVVNLTKIKYVRRPYDEDNGTFLDYTVYTKNTEAEDWEAAVSGSWTWKSPNREQMIEFETPVAAKYVMLVADRTVKDNNFASASEIEFYENVATRPEITSQPKGGYSDSSITLSVEATSDGSSLINYQWYENSENSLFGATEITGATDSSYVVNLAEGQKKYYFVKVTNAETGISIISDIVMAGHGTDTAMVNGTAYSDLASAVNAANANDIVYVLRDQEISSTIAIGKNITIEAEAGTTVVLKRSEEFTNGFMFNIQNGATLNVSRTASGKVIIDGGNIVSEKGAVNITRGVFNLNSNGVIRSNNSTSNGAAVYTGAGGGSQINIYGVVTGNHTDRDGGAIYSNGYTYINSSSEISNNNAGGNAGAVYNYGGGIAEIRGGNHFKNTAVGNGGFFWADGKTTINGGTISGNSAAYGGGIYNNASSGARTLVFTGSTVSGNTASVFGNDIYTNTNHVSFKGNITVGDIYIPSGVSLIVNGAITGSVGFSYGGEPAADGTTIFTGSGYTIKASDAERIKSVDERMVSEFANSSVVVKYAPVKINTQPQSIDRVSMGDTKTLSITAESLTETEVHYQWYRCDDAEGSNPTAIDGAVSSEYNPDTNVEGTFYYYCVVSADKAQNNTSEIASVRVVDDTFSEIPMIVTQPQGGTYDIRHQANLSVEARVTDNGTLSYQWYAAEDGQSDGKLLAGKNTAEISLDNEESGTYYYYCVVTNTVEGKEARSIKSDRAEVVVTDAVAAFNDVKYSNFSEAVTALKEAGNNGTLEIYKDVILTETINVNSGVNLIVRATPVGEDVPRIVLANNFRSEAFVVNGGNLTINNVAIDGGAIWSYNNLYYEEYLGRGSRNTGRSSSKPLVTISNNGTVTLNGSASLQNNVADGISGGAVLMSNGTFNMNDNSQIKDNYAGSHGGALYSSSSNSKINITGNSLVSGNQGGSSTGGICADTGTILTISGGVIEKNFTGGRAGGMFTNGTFNMTGGEIRNNYAGTNGGGMIINGGTINISGGSISNNTSGTFGGGISLLAGNVTISADAVVSNNKAGTNGGGIAATGGNLTVNGGRFSDNIAGGNGGAVYRSTENSTGRIDIDFTSVDFNNNKSVVTGENDGTLNNVYVTRSTNLGTITANAANDEAFYNAIYFEHTFVVTLHTGIDGETIAESVRFMGKYDLPEPPRNGYKFLGWFDAAEDGNKIENGSCVLTKSNHNLYAHWERTATETINITQQPVGGVMYIEDNNVLTVEAEVIDDATQQSVEKNISYQWYEINSETNKPVEIAGANSPSIILDTSDRNLGIYNFFCVLSSENTADVKTETARVEFISKDVAVTPIFNTQPNNVDCFVGDDAVFNSNATTVDLGTVTYQWYRSTDTIISKDDEAIEGATEASYCENTSKAGTYYYYVIATNTITDTKGQIVTSNAASNVAKLVCHNRITVSTVNSNDVVMTPSYWNKYAVGYKTTDSADGYIGNVASCYGSYGNNTVEKAFDGNWNTFWETNRGGVNNYLEFTFVDSVKVDRILYATRQDGYKGRGYPTTLTIYMAEDEQNYVEVGVAKSSENSGYVMFTFPETIEFKGKMRFEFTSSTFGNWASASELILLRDESTVLDGRATISGNAVPGQTLTANVYDSNAVDFTYQWQYSKDGETFANIEGATESTYTIKEDDKDGYLRVVLRDKSKTYAGTITSSSYKGLFEAHLDGKGVIGTTLTAKTNYTAENASFKYVWQRKSAEGDYVNIEFQNYSSTYNISVFDINSYIRVGIKYDDSANAKNDVTDLSGYVFSEPVFVDVQAIMTGAPQVGGVLTASLTGYKESVNYQWQVGDTEDGEFTDIDGATDSEFTITEEYLNRYIRVSITVTESSRELISVAWQVAEAGTYPEASGDHIYVTDMPRANLITSSVGYGGSVKYDTNTSGGTISLKVDGERKYFMKGLGAHAAANMVYDVSDYVKYYHYNRFIAYLGLDYAQGSNGDGVKFTIYTAEVYDGANTNWKQVQATGVLKGTSEAVYVDLDLTGVNYIRIAIGMNGNNASDHSVVADAKLATTDYEPIDTSEFINRVEYYDEKLKAYEAEHQGTSYTELLKNEEYELLLLQRTFVSNATYAVLSSFLFNDENIETLQWFMNDIEALRLYIGGGKPDGSYTRSLNVLKNLYIKHKADLDDPVNGALYKKMMITLSLTHSADVYFWQDSSQKSDPVRRYEIYKKLYDNELLITDVFKNLEVEEMRWVMNNIISDDQIEWLNYYVRYHTNIGNKEINKNNYTPGPYYFITYTMGFNYNQPQFYDPKKQASWEEEWKLDNQYLGTGILSNNVQDQEKIKVYDIDVEYGKVKLWVVFEAGAVCGGISKTGSNLNTVFGIPSVVIGQPGHAAYLQFAANDSNSTTGTWGIHNDISGWTGSEKGERMLNGWGNYSWDSAYQVSYVLLAQAALNQPDKYYEAEKLIKIADMYKDDPYKRIEIYREALEVQDINLDAWIALIDAYKQAGKTPEDFSKLAVEISNALTYYPLPMWDVLERLIKPNVRGEEKFLGEVSSCQTMALTRAKNATGSDTLQDTACRTMANHLLGNNNFKMATFSFDGDKANTIVLNEMYSGGNEVLICLNGNPGDPSDKSWISLGLGKELALTGEQLAMITPENDIHVRLQGTTSYYTIDITAGSLPSGLYRNDNENRITGNTANLEYKISGEEEWHDMTSDVRFEGDVTISVRKKATGTSLQSGESQFTFTYDKDSENRKYIPLNRIEYIGCSSEQVDKGGSAKNALDGNINTIWHTWWAGGDNQRYIIVKLDEPVYLTAFDYTPNPAGNGNGRFQTCEIYTSLTGEDNTWDLSGRATGWGNNANVKSLELYNPVYTQYIKVVGAQAVGNFGTAAMFEFFEDTTVENKAIKSIEVKTTPGRTEYVVGDELDITGLEVMATFDDDSHSILSNSLLKFSPTIFKSAGEQTITVTSSQNSNATAEFKVNVSENTKEVSDIFVDHLPEKTRYFVGDSIVTEGLVVKANYTDGSQGYIFENQYTVTPETFYDSGKEFPVTVTYTADDTKTTEFNVEVTKNVKEIFVSQSPEKAIYYLGDSLDTTGITVSVKYTDGTVEELESYDYIVKSSGFSSTSSTKDITVEYQRIKDFSATFQVLVYPYITYNGLRFESVDNEETCYVSGVAEELEPNSVVTIPSTVKVGDLEFTVIGISKDSANATGAFENQTDIIGINLPATVTDIKADAFKGCTNLKEIYLNEHTDFSNLVVENGAFANDENNRGKIYVATEALAAKLNGLIAEGGNVEGLKYFTAESVTNNIESINVTLPEKIDYHLGESLDLTGMKVIGVTTDGQEIELADSLYTVSGFDSTTAGNKNITVTLNNTVIEYTFPVRVIPAAPEITKQPVGNVYTTGADKDALTVEATIGDSGNISYQWYSNTSESTQGAEKIDGATESTYKPENEVKTFYYVVVSNNDKNGNENTAISVTSDIVCVDVGDYSAKIDGVGYDTLQNAVNAAEDGDKVELIKNIDLTSQVIFNQNKNITLSGMQIKRTKSTEAVALLRIESGNVVLENIVLDGGAVWNGAVDSTLNRGTGNSGINAANSLVTIVGGSLTLSDGGVLQNNCNTSGEYGYSGGAVRISGSAKLILDGGSIINNYCNPYGGAVLSLDNSSIVINDGTVSGNHGQSSGGTFCVDNSSTITVNGGTLNNNKGNAAGGVIWLAGGTATLNGGSIKNNASGTGTVYMSGNGTVNLGNITMSGNVSSNGGTAVYNNSGTVKITGRPSLSDNTIYLPSGKNISVQANLAGADKIFVAGGSDMTAGRTIANVANADFVKAAAETLTVSGYTSYAEGNTVKIGNVVNLTWSKDLPANKTIFAGTQLELEVEAAGADNITYTWYICDDASGTNPIEINTTSTEPNKLIYGDCDEGVCYFYCVASVDDGVSKDIQSEIVTVNILKFVPCSQAVEKFSNV